MMDNIREKLVELLMECDSKFDVLACYDEQTISNSASILADHLIANGVTIERADWWEGEAYEPKRGETDGLDQH